MMMPPVPDPVLAFDQESRLLFIRANDELVLGNQAQGEALLRQAYQRKLAAALATDVAGDPRRWKYFREAARWAITCHDYAAAQKIVTEALSGPPPEDCMEYLQFLLAWAVRGRLPKRGLAPWCLTLSGSRPVGRRPVRPSRGGHAPMTPVECLILLGNLSRTHEWLLPGESIPFRQYWRYCLGAFGEEVRAALRASQIVIWVDAQPVLDPASDVPVTCGSQFALSLSRRWLTEVLPHGAWWN